jgi:acyl carrier protein
MQKAEIIAMVNEVFVEEFEMDAEALKPDAQIFQELGLDSLDIVDLIVALQKKFGVNFRSDERIREIRSLTDLYEFVFGLTAELNPER